MGQFAKDWAGGWQARWDANRSKAALLRGQMWQDPGFRAGLYYDPRIGRHAGVPMEEYPEGLDSGQIDEIGAGGRRPGEDPEGNRLILRHATRLPASNIPPEVYTDEMAQREARAAQAEYDRAMAERLRSGAWGDDTPPAPGMIKISVSDGKGGITTRWGYPETVPVEEPLRGGVGGERLLPESRPVRQVGRIPGETRRVGTKGAGTAGEPSLGNGVKSSPTPPRAVPDTELPPPVLPPSSGAGDIPALPEDQPGPSGKRPLPAAPARPGAKERLFGPGGLGKYERQPRVGHPSPAFDDATGQPLPGQVVSPPGLPLAGSVPPAGEPAGMTPMDMQASMLAPRMLAPVQPGPPRTLTAMPSPEEALPGEPRIGYPSPPPRRVGTVGGAGVGQAIGRPTGPIATPAPATGTAAPVSEVGAPPPVGDLPAGKAAGPQAPVQAYGTPDVKEMLTAAGANPRLRAMLGRFDDYKDALANADVRKEIYTTMQQLENQKLREQERIKAEAKAGAGKGAQNTAARVMLGNYDVLDRPNENGKTAFDASMDTSDWNEAMNLLGRAVPFGLAEGVTDELQYTGKGVGYLPRIAPSMQTLRQIAQRPGPLQEPAVRLNAAAGWAPIFARALGDVGNLNQQEQESVRNYFLPGGQHTKSANILLAKLGKDLMTRILNQGLDPQQASDLVIDMVNQGLSQTGGPTLNRRAADPTRFQRFQTAPDLSIYEQAEE